MKTKDEMDVLKDVCKAVCLMLPDWTLITERNGNPCLILHHTESGALIWANGSGWAGRGRFSFSLDTNRTTEHGIVTMQDAGIKKDNERPSITVSQTKSPAKIVRDLERRLFPEAIKLTKALNTYLDERAEVRKGYRARAEKIAEQLGAELHTPYGSKEETNFSFYFDSPDIYYENISLRHGRLCVELHTLDEELQDEIIEFIKTRIFHRKA